MYQCQNKMHLGIIAMTTKAQTKCTCILIKAIRHTGNPRYGHIKY